MELPKAINNIPVSKIRDVLSLKEVFSSLLSFLVDKDLISVEVCEHTPMRMSHAYKELVSGYDVDIRQLLSKRFNCTKDTVVITDRIPFYSLCEHHLLPFFGQISIGFITNEETIGLSKLPKLVKAYSQRIQIQENMTEQIGASLYSQLSPQAIAVKCEATHLCVSMRGVKSPMSTTTWFTTGNKKKIRELKRLLH